MILKEEIAGTNAVSLAIREKKTIIVIKEQHYIEELKKLSCLASPIFNRDGNLIGVVDISSENDIGHDFAALIFLLARDIERNYQIIWDREDKKQIWWNGYKDTQAYGRRENR